MADVSQGREARVIGALCALMIAALMVIGAVSHEVIRHAIQSIPALAAAACALAGARWAKWLAVPVFAVWLLISVLIWLFLLGYSHIIDGTFSPPEVAMTVVLAICGLIGLAMVLRRPGGTAWPVAMALVVLFAAAQIGALQLSFGPAYAHDPPGIFGR